MGDGFNIDGTINPKAQGGLVPTVGMARGGTQGRLGLMHNGVGGATAGGGFQPGASPRAAAPAPRAVASNLGVQGLPPHIAQMLKQLVKMQQG